MRPHDNRRTAAIHPTTATRPAMEAATTAAGDLNDIGMYSRCWLRQRHGVGHTKGGNGSSQKCCCKKCLHRLSSCLAATMRQLQ